MGNRPQKGYDYNRAGVAMVTRRSQERTNRQEPIIKGVLPDSPAPVATPRAEAPAAPTSAGR